MKTLKTDFYLEVEHKGTTFQVPKQSGKMLYIRFIHGSDEDIIIQVDFPSDSPDPSQLAMSYNMEPEKRKYVSDDDLQHIGEALMLLVGAIPDEQHNNSAEESNRQSIIPQENHSSPEA